MILGSANKKQCIELLNLIVYVPLLCTLTGKLVHQTLMFSTTKLSKEAQVKGPKESKASVSEYVWSFTRFLYGCKLHTTGPLHFLDHRKIKVADHNLLRIKQAQNPHWL